MSDLQKYILFVALGENRKFGRGKLLSFYDKRKKEPKLETRVNIITKSIERLIERGLLYGYGVRTPEKWFIEEIWLTKAGRREAKKFLGEQQKLPFRK